MEIRNLEDIKTLINNQNKIRKLSICSIGFIFSIILFKASDTTFFINLALIISFASFFCFSKILIKNQRIFLCVISFFSAIIIFILGTGYNSDFLMISSVVIIYFTVLVLKQGGFKPEVIKEDILNTSSIKDRLGDAICDTNGVFAGLDNKAEEVYITTQDRAVVIGPPGTGKTSFQINQIYKWIETNNSFVCLDIKPEIAEITKETLRAKGYNIIIYNPTTPVDKYNFIADLDTPEAIGEFASAMIPSSGGENAVFDETARDFLDAIILHVKSLKNDEQATLSGVYDLMTNYDNIKALLNDLSHSKNDQCKRIVKTLKIVADNERLLGSIFANFVSNLRFLRYENIRSSLGKGGFQLNVLEQQKTALFLQFEESKNKTTGHLFSVMVGHVMNHLITHTDREPVLCLFDEIGNAGKVNDLTTKLNTIRSRKMPTWLYFQSMEQMQRYGEKANEGANIILGACDLQMCFRLNDNATAEWFANKIGTQEVINYTVSTNDEISTSESISREHIIHPHELQQLNNNQVIASYRGANWLGIAEPYHALEQKNN